MKREIIQNTPYGSVKATWEPVGGGKIEVSYGGKVKKVKAGESEASNDFIAGNVLQGWITVDLAEAD